MRKPKRVNERTWEPKDDYVRSQEYIHNPWASPSFELNSAHRHLKANDQNLIQQSIQRTF